MKTFVTISALFFCLFSSAQDTGFGLTLQVGNPVPDDIKVGWFDIDSESIDDYNLNHKSFAAGALLNYKLRQDMTLRFRFGWTKIYIDEYSKTVSDLSVNNESNVGKQNNYHFAPGVVWTMGENKLEFFAGFEMPINIHGEFTMNWTTFTTTQSGAVYSDVLETRVIPKGHSFGIAAITGFHYTPIKWFSVGAEFSPSLLYAKLSGETTYSRNDKVTPENNFETNTQDENKGFTFSENRFSINFSFLF